MKMKKFLMTTLCVTILAGSLGGCGFGAKTREADIPVEVQDSQEETEENTQIEPRQKLRHRPKQRLRKKRRVRRRIMHRQSI